jgi:hypothetical protein
MDGEALKGELVYRCNEYSVDFIPDEIDLIKRVDGAGTSILIGSLHLEVSIVSGEVLFPWGMFPHVRWKKKSLVLPDFKSGRLYLESDLVLERGVGVGLENYQDSWCSYYDQNSGWIYYGVDDFKLNKALQFATDVVASLLDGKIVGLWMRPNLNNS